MPEWSRRGNPRAGAAIARIRTQVPGSSGWTGWPARVRSGPHDEKPARIEPARLEETPEAIADAIAALSSASAALGARLHPATAANLSDLVRLMNCYYSNLIEGHDTQPRDKEWMDRADTPRQGDLDGRGNLSRRALVDFTLWFLKVCIDQVTFMKSESAEPRIAGLPTQAIS